MNGEISEEEALYLSLVDQVFLSADFLRKHELHSRFKLPKDRSLDWPRFDGDIGSTNLAFALPPQCLGQDKTWAVLKKCWARPPTSTG